ncbi:hypothetical protein GTA08_BOTSDO10432 [Botryosphaeria dothidea]|uniref:Uncharacterized protein n=1 Tax=Botryosphaeria dothidea TaxID=55169 RepID=A0A8H4IJG2_9PEZI|nr:hypothetical protein GTA08_BOTSDO10432 [Botryosphaeria dothidea]
MFVLGRGDRGPLCLLKIKDAKLVDRFSGLSGDGQMAFTANTSWTSPCHWQYALHSDESTFFDSGWVDATNEKVTPAVT